MITVLKNICSFSNDSIEICKWFLCFFNYANFELALRALWTKHQKITTVKYFHFKVPLEFRENFPPSHVPTPLSKQNFTRINITAFHCSVSYFSLIRCACKKFAGDPDHQGNFEEGRCVRDFCSCLNIFFKIPKKSMNCYSI